MKETDRLQGAVLVK